MFTPAKVIFFTASAVPTAPELADIAQLENDGRYAVVIRNTLGGNYTGGEPEACSFVAGTIPEEYEDEEEYPVIDPDALPDPTNVPTTAKIIKSGVEFLAPAPTGSRVDGYTPTIVDGVVTGLVGS